MAKPPPRRATLVLCRPNGELLGRLPEVPVATPWWQDAAPVVDAVREAFGIDVVVLRMLETQRKQPQGGWVTYLAEVSGELPDAVRAQLAPANVELDEQPLRQPWARPGGPDADLAWADGALRGAGLARGGAAQQVRTWNLSSIWQLPLAGGGAAWLKVVPPFFAHEGSMLRLLEGTGAPVPRLIAADGPRLLLADIPGEDRYDAPPAELLRMVFALVHLQSDWVGRETELLGKGMPDWRSAALGRRIEELVARERDGLPDEVRATLDGFVEALPARLAVIDACGVPTTFVHGDFHPGNIRGDGGTAQTILDWGDCGLGNPLLDLPAFLEVSPSSHVNRIRDAWTGAWLRRVPSADPARAAELLAPVAAARQALVYDTFVRNIEPVERRYHESDVPRWLKRTAQLVERESAG
jgi:hypothetical protein